MSKAIEKYFTDAYGQNQITMSWLRMLIIYSDNFSSKAKAKKFLGLLQKLKLNKMIREEFKLVIGTEKQLINLINKHCQGDDITNDLKST